jgi:serine/threonine protein kinase
MKKWVSEDTAGGSAGIENRDFKKDNIRKNRQFYKDSDYIVDRHRNDKLVEHEEEKIEIVYEEIEDEDDLEPQCKTDVSLDDFRVKRLIDKGAFGEVFLTECLKDGKLYAMKRIKKSILNDKSLKQSTENEKQILMNLSHPFLLTMSYLIENDKRYYFFLEYISGGNLFKNMFKVKRFEEEAVKFYAAQLASGLGYLHENNLVHRDLKLENVLMDKDGYLKLCDFGLAKLLN